MKFYNILEQPVNVLLEVQKMCILLEQFDSY